MSNVESFIQQACTALGCRATSDDQRDLAHSFGFDGISQRYWEKAIEETADDARKTRARATIQKCIANYAAICQANKKVDCNICLGSGWIHCITVTGMYECVQKCWIVDISKHQKFLKQEANKGNEFKASESPFPCRCENGERHNKKNGYDWLSESQRSLAASRHIPDNLILSQWVDFLNLLSKGHGKEFQPIDVDGMAVKFTEAGGPANYLRNMMSDIGGLN